MLIAIIIGNKSKRRQRTIPMPIKSLMLAKSSVI
jgi:hypothetical protein